jgi:hypothetical protein
MLLLKNAVGMISSISISFFFGLYIYLKHRTNTDYQCIHIYIYIYIFFYIQQKNEWNVGTGDLKLLITSTDQITFLHRES